ncbi:retrotransposon protein, putative, ty1-copia subclass [Tanacetum coccineum]
MMVAKFDIKKFNGTGDFGLWRIKMRALLSNMDGKSRSKSRGESLKFYIFQSEDYLKRNCPKNNRKKSTCYVKKDDQPRSSGSTYDNSEVMMVMSAEVLLDWIMDSGCSYHMTPRVVLSGTPRDNCIYSLDGQAVADELNASVEEKDSLAQVWHKRLGHISEAGLQVLEKQGLFGKKSLDLWGLSQVESLGGKRYFLSIVDDYSRRVWVYILRFKHESFEKFIEWKQLVENQIRRTVKKLRTDDGLEFCNREFEQLCIESGIARHLTVVGTPQQNEVAERMNNTLMDKMWSGHPSDYGILRIFGCVAYPHDKQGKLELRAIKCVLLGYPDGVKGYRLYRLDDESPKIVTSRNVVFNESVIYKDTLKDSDVGADKFVKELQVEVELQRLNNHTPEEDQTDQEDDDDEDAGDQETNETPDLTDY